MSYGTGRSAPSARSLVELMKHRRVQLLALASHAAERADLERELASLDRDIAAGIVSLEAKTEAERVELERQLRRPFKHTTE